MKIQTIHYERCLGLPNFSNLKVGITVQVDEGESPDEVFDKARIFVHAKLRLLSGESLDQPRRESDLYGAEGYDEEDNRPFSPHQR